MATGSYILVGLGDCPAVLATVADRALSRHAALKQWSGRKIIDDLASEGTLIHSPSTPASPGAYKDIGAVVAAAEHAGLARRVARLRPLICIKGLARLTDAAENAIIDSFERGRALLQHLIWGSSETWAQLYYVPLSSILLPTRSGHRLLESVR